MTVRTRKGQLKRRYEMACIIRPQRDEDIAKVVAWIREGITSKDGMIVKEIAWGHRSLAYPIRRLTKGYYYLFYCDLPREKIVEIERRNKLNEDVLRSMIFLFDEKSGHDTIEFKKLGEKVMSE